MALAETRETASEGAATRARVPLRGTQSLVAVIGQVWRRPGLTGMELLWRWGAGLPLLLLAGWAGSRALAGSLGGLAAVEQIDVLVTPAAAAAWVTREWEVLLPPLIHVMRWWLPLALAVWTVASAIGRTWIWRRIDPTLRSRRVLTGCLGLLRSCVLLGVLGIWIWGMIAAGRYAIAAPVRAGAEPNLVLYTALAVSLTLLVFMLWSVTSWVLDAAPLFGMAERLDGGGGAGLDLLESLRAAFRARALRSKLIETNLVMGIVKVALLVLAMVFSASPLPFVSVETAAFLRSWWAFIGVLFLAFLDMFHVVRRAAYLQLFRALVTPQGDTKKRSEPVS